MSIGTMLNKALFFLFKSVKSIFLRNINKKIIPQKIKLEASFFVLDNKQVF